MPKITIDMTIFEPNDFVVIRLLEISNNTILIKKTYKLPEQKLVTDLTHSFIVK